MAEVSLLMYKNGKMRPAETTPAMGGELKENGGGGEFN
jgi:hypothetical protein